MPGSTARSQFQIERGVDAQLLAPDLQPYLDSDKLSKRLSELLTNHIRDRWAPQMRSKVERASKEVEARLKQCGVPPPTAEADVPAIASQQAPTVLTASAGASRRVALHPLAPHPLAPLRSTVPAQLSPRAPQVPGRGAEAAPPKARRV